MTWLFYIQDLFEILNIRQPFHKLFKILQKIHLDIINNNISKKYGEKDEESIFFRIL